MAHKNERLIAICKEAKKYLRKGEGSSGTTYVCHAIRYAVEALGGGWTIPEKLQSLVSKHIGRGQVMDDFLRTKFGERKVDAMTYAQIQAWRFLMLNNMIKMLQEEEGKKA